MLHYVSMSYQQSEHQCVRLPIYNTNTKILSCSDTPKNEDSNFMIFISTNNLGYPRNQRGNMHFIILRKKFKTEISVMFSSLLREQEL
jgi:hypothetical protein